LEEGGKLTRCSRKQFPFVKNCDVLIFVFILTTSLNITKDSEHANNSIDIWFQRKGLFFPVGSKSVKKDLSITEDSLMGSVFSFQSGFKFIFKILDHIRSAIENKI